MAQAMGGTFYDPARHELIDSNLWVSAVRKAAIANAVENAENLFLYHHRLADTFVLAMWVHKPGSDYPARMLELLVTHGPPGHEKYGGVAFDTPTIGEVVDRLAPAGVHALKFRKQEEAERARVDKEFVADFEARDRAASAMERHDKGAADLIRSGAVPIAAGDDNLGDTLVDRSKGSGNFKKNKGS